uniref:Uncharacterized protein n=1 Tax=Ciona intestinalis TaxID=7719 RepID=L7N0U0_CIOIN
MKFGRKYKMFFLIFCTEWLCLYFIRQVDANFLTVYDQVDRFILKQNN